MPTGYTADLYEGKDVTFEEFALGCARAFGALITMRDDDSQTPIPEQFEPSEFYANELREAQAELAEAEQRTDADWEALVLKSHEENLTRISGWKTRDAARKERYEGMLSQVEAWEPPTDEHQGLKEFMAEQLRSSIDFDTTQSYPEPVLKSASAFRAEVLDS